jgi:hypothetical protein
MTFIFPHCDKPSFDDSQLLIGRTTDQPSDACQRFTTAIALAFETAIPSEHDCGATGSRWRHIVENRFTNQV